GSAQGDGEGERGRTAVALGSHDVVDRKGGGVVVLDRPDCGGVGQGDPGVGDVLEDHREGLVVLDEVVTGDGDGHGLGCGRCSVEDQGPGAGNVVAAGAGGDAAGGVVDTDSTLDGQSEGDREDQVSGPGGVTLGDRDVVDGEGGMVVVLNRAEAAAVGDRGAGVRGSAELHGEGLVGLGRGVGADR